MHTRKCPRICGSFENHCSPNFSNSSNVFEQEDRRQDGAAVEKRPWGPIRNKAPRGKLNPTLSSVVFSLSTTFYLQPFTNIALLTKTPPQQASPKPAEKMNSQGLTIYDQEREEVAGLRLQLEASREEVEEGKRNLAACEESYVISQREVRRLEGVVKERETEIAALEVRVAKMDKTIKVQSETIASNPSPLRRTPQHQVDTARAAAMTAGGPPPAFNPRRHQASSSFAAPALPRQASSFVPSAAEPVSTSSAPAPRRAAVNPFADPPVRAGVHMGLAGKKWENVVPHGVHSRGLPAPAPKPGSAEMSSSLVVMDADRNGFKFGDELDHLFKTTKEWVRSFANVPTSNDSKLPRHLFKHLGSFCHETMVLSLLSAGSTRHQLICRYLVSFFTSEVLTVNLVRTYDAPKEQFEISAALDKIQPGLSNNDLRTYHQVRSDAVLAIMSMPGYENWITSKAQRSAKAMMQNLAPLLAPGADRAEAELGYIWEEAFKLGVKMYSVPCTYKWDYVKHGQNAFFNPSTMVNQDVNIQGTPKDIRNAQWRVRCCITPVAVMTDMMKPTLAPMTVRLAEVLLCK